MATSPPTLAEIRVTRIDHNLCDLQRLTAGKRVLVVRYTRTLLIALYIP